MPQSPEQRAVIQRMIDAGESEENIGAVIRKMTTDTTKTSEGPKERTVFEHAGSFAGNLLQGLNPIRMAEGAYQLVRHPYDTVIEPTLTNLNKSGQALRAGDFKEAANRFAGAVPLIGPAADDISAQMKSGDTAGGLGKMTALIAGPKVVKSAGGIAKAAATGLAKVPMPNASAAVRAAALEHRALPGIFRTGASRTASRIDDVGRNIDLEVAADPTAVISAARAGFTPKAFDALKGRLRNAPGLEDARKASADVRAELRADPTVAAVNTVARGSYAKTTGRTDPASLVEREAADNVMREMGRSMPSATPFTAKMPVLQEVAQAHATRLPQMSPGTPALTFQQRIALNAANRLAAPATQGIYNAGRAAQALPIEAIRAAMLAELMKHSGGENR